MVMGEVCLVRNPNAVVYIGHSVLYLRDLAWTMGCALDLLCLLIMFGCGQLVLVMVQYNHSETHDCALMLLSVFAVIVFARNGP